MSVAWPLALCLLGIGSQAAFDLLLYVPALSAIEIDEGLWDTRGVAVVLSLLLFAAGAWRMPGVGSRAFVSRHVVVFTTTAIAIGVYVAVSLFGGFYLRSHGGNWGNAFQVAFLFAAAALLALLLLADSPLRRLRVFISTHFYRNKYDYRVEWMRFVQTLSTPDEGDIHRTAVRAVAQIFGSSGGLLVLNDEESGRFDLRATWPESYEGQVECGSIDSDHSLPRFLRERQWVIDLHEYRDSPQTYGGLELPRWLESPGPWRVIAPLLVGSELLGFLVLRAPAEPFIMNFEDRDLLKTLGRNVAVQLAQHRADEKLSQSRQFDAYNRFTAFVMHDLKNSVAQLQLLVANAARHRHNPVFVEDAIGTIQNTAGRMTRLIEQLQSRDMQGKARPVDVAAIARAAVARSGAREPPVDMLPVAHELSVDADPERLGAVIDHVIRNAQEATPAGRAISLRIDEVGDQAHLHVIDEGAGMEPDFVRERLFRPFDSTKGSKGMGIGAYQTREYARWLGGDVEVQSTPGKGTDFCIKLPLCQTRS
jgi:putative PEP-CTERM system histidine kinase